MSYKAALVGCGAKFQLLVTSQRSIVSLPDVSLDAGSLFRASLTFRGDWTHCEPDTIASETGDSCSFVREVPTGVQH